jgi:hypothetical protein
MKNKLHVLRIIGDCHQLYDKYHSLIKKVKYSLLLGDFGLSNYETLNNVDPKYHRILNGNHCNYDIKDLYPHFLGDFGQLNIPPYNIFFIRGALSVDKQWRIPHVSWWPQEELNFQQTKACIDEYSRIKPDFVVSHAAPHMCKQYGILTNPGKILESYTENLLQELWNIHQPKKWTFCHYHCNKQFKIGRTDFTCLNELNYLDLPL